MPTAGHLARPELHKPCVHPKPKIPPSLGAGAFVGCTVCTAARITHCTCIAKFM